MAFTAPSNCYLALYINDPGENGTSGTEINYQGYTRQPINFSEPAPTSGGIGIQNLFDIKFPTPATAAGTVTHIGILDSQSNGNMLARGELTEPLVVGNKQPPVFLVGDVLFYITGSLSTAYRKRLLNVLRGQTLQGITPHFSLWNGSPESTGAELSGDNYARVPITFSAPEEQAGGQLLAQNSLAATFNRPSTNWGVWSWSAIYSAETSGEPVFLQQLTESIDIKRGYMPTFDLNTIKVGIN